MHDYDREKLEYRPLLQYVKEFALSLGRQDYSIPEEILEFSTHSPSITIEELAEAEKILDKAMNLIEERLQDDIALIDHSMEEIERYCGESFISFQSFQKAVSDTENMDAAIIIGAYEEYHSAIDKRYEALLYRSLYNAKEEVLAERDSMENTFSQLITSPSTSSLSLTLEEKERDFTRNWIQVKRRESELKQEIEDLEPTADISDNEDIANKFKALRLEYAEVSRQSRSFEVNPLAATSKSYYDTAQEAKDLGTKTYNLMMHTVSDSFHGMLGYIIKKIVRLNKGTFNVTEFRALVNDSIDICKSIQLGIQFISLGASIEAISITNALQSMISTVVGGIIPQIMNVFSSLKMGITIPILNWLDELAEEDPDSDLLPMNKLASVLLDALDEIDDQFRRTIMEFHKIGLLKRDRENILLASIEHRKWMSDLNTVLDQIIQELQNIRNINNIDEFILDKWVLNILSDNGWDVRFDSNSGQYERVETLLKPY
jgi:hypothetical protein